MYSFGLVLLKCFLSLLLLVPFAAADPQTMIVGGGAMCENRGTYETHGSSFEKNLNRVLLSLVENAGEIGFNVSSYDDELKVSKIYGLVQCRGDMNPFDCRECVSFAKQALLDQCSSHVAASILLDGCFLRYANYNFYSTLTESASGTKIYWNCQRGTKIYSNSCQSSKEARIFNATLIATLSETLADLVNKAIISINSFSANLAVVSPSLTIYSLAQCWRDLNVEDCGQCLSNLNDTIFSKWLAEATGAQVFTLNCFLRFEIYSFFHLAVISTSQAVQSESTVIQQVCHSGELYTGKDVQLVLDSLVASVNKTGFTTFTHGSTGSDEDTIYGMAQCRGDLNATECGECVLIAKQNLLQTCRRSSATNILSGCFLRYEINNNFYSKLEVQKNPIVECQNINSPQPRIFDSSILTTLPKLIDRAISNKGFSTSEDNLTRLPQTIYSLAQCWKDVDMKACRQCLDYVYPYLLNCSQGALGGQVVSNNCYLRYLTVNFFHGDDSSEESKRSTLIIILSTGISGTASMVIVLAVVLRKGRIMGWLNKKVDIQQKDEDISGAAYGAMTEFKLNYNFETLQSCTGNFNPENKLGQGGFGLVYKGVLPNGREIAVKRLLFFNKERGVHEFLNEVNIISHVRHKNLVKLVGCSVKGHERLLVYEYLPNKSLDHHLFDPVRNKALNWEKRFEIILGTAAGLAYLHHESEIRIIHRDIKASNILLDLNFKPKIADFGLARHLNEDQSHISTGIAGTLGYMAPEYIVHGQLTEKADIFSFGVLVLEILSGRKNNHFDPTEDIQSLSQLIWKHFKSNTVSRALDPNLLEMCTEEDEKGLYNAVHVGLLCTQASPALRPAMPQVVQMLVSNNPINLPLPAQPPFMNLQARPDEAPGFIPSFNNFSYSDFEPR